MKILETEKLQAHMLLTFPAAVAKHLTKQLKEEGCCEKFVPVVIPRPPIKLDLGSEDRVHIHLARVDHRVFCLGKIKGHTQGIRRSKERCRTPSIRRRREQVPPSLHESLRFIP